MRLITPVRHSVKPCATLVENRLSDLWSLFDFLNPGLLGTFNAFKTFSRGLQEHPEGYGRLRRVISPCGLRRLKTDTSIRRQCRSQCAERI